LRAEIGPLPIHGGRIVNLPKQLQELFVRHQRGIVLDLDHFGVTALVGADLAIGRMFEPAAHVAGGRGDNPVELAERGLDAPEASAAESGYPFSRHRPLDILSPSQDVKGRPLLEGALPNRMAPLPSIALHRRS